MSRATSTAAVLALLAAGVANAAYLAVAPVDGTLGGHPSARVIATVLAAGGALAAGWLAERSAPRLLLLLTAVSLLLAGGVTPVLAVGAPILLALLTGLAQNLAAVTADLPELRLRLLVLAAVGLGGPPVVALAHVLV